MRYLKILLLFIGFSMLFTNCGNDESNNGDIEITEENIAGTWNITEYHGNTTGNYQIQGFDTLIENEVEATEFNEAITLFNTNPNTVTQSGSMTVHTITKATTMGQTNVVDEQDVVVNFDPTVANTWHIVNEDELEIESTSQGGVPLPNDLDNYVIKITELTNSTMKLKLTGDGTVDFGGDEMPIVVEFYYTFTR
jgi:hypothetical protein